MKRFLFALFAALVMPVFAHAASPCGPYRVPVVVIGDGHGVALSRASDGCWTNMAKIGRSIFDPEIEMQLRSFPPGTPVVISLGHADTKIASSANWKSFRQTAMWIALLADQQHLRWIWIEPPCLPDMSTDWIRTEIMDAVDISQTWDWPYCRGTNPQRMPNAEVFYNTQILNIEGEFLKRFSR